MTKLILLSVLLIFCFSVSSSTSSSFHSLSQDDLQAKFSDWMTKHNKDYSGSEMTHRFGVWKENLEFVMEHNARTDVTFTVAMNKFADLTSEEFSSLYLIPTKKVELPELSTPEPYALANPSFLDWRDKKVVTGVKDQGQCGSCWSFSTTGAVEGAYALGTGNLLSLSEQDLVSCSPVTSGCNGGWPILAMKWLMQDGGLPSEEDYPYTSGQTLQNGTCEVGHSKVATIHGAHTVTRGSEAALETEVATVGPVSVCIDASHQSFHLYQSGVFVEPNCTTTNMSHAVLAVGYDNTLTSESQQYWIVKNSWGEGWGENGYVKMLKGSSNQCGIATEAVSAYY